MKSVCDTCWAAYLTVDPTLSDTRLDHAERPTRFVPDPGETCVHHGPDAAATHYVPDSAQLPVAADPEPVEGQEVVVGEPHTDLTRKAAKKK